MTTARTITLPEDLAPGDVLELGALGAAPIATVRDELGPFGDRLVIVTRTDGARVRLLAGHPLTRPASRPPAVLGWREPGERPFASVAEARDEALLAVARVAGAPRAR